LWSEILTCGRWAVKAVGVGIGVGVEGLRPSKPEHGMGWWLGGGKFGLSFEFEKMNRCACDLSGKQEISTPFNLIGVRRRISFLTLIEEAYDE
jgi:hypothetical protein